MTESLTLKPEIIRSTGLHTDIEELTVTEALENHIKLLECRLEEEPNRRFADFYKKYKRKKAKLCDENGNLLFDNIPADRRLSNWKDRVEEMYVRTFGHDALDEYRGIVDAIYYSIEYEKIFTTPKQGDELLRHIIDNAGNQQGHYAHVFLRPTGLRNRAESNSAGFYIKTDSGVEIPTDMFVSATSFESWWGRNHGAADRSGKKIDTYTTMETKPTIEDADIFITKDNKVLVITNNAHRVAAAIRRGDPTIKLDGVFSVRSVGKDYEEFVAGLDVHEPRADKVADTQNS